MVVTVGGVLCLHAYFLLMGLAGENAWPLFVGGAGLLIFAGGWGGRPLSTASFLEAGRVLGWSHRPAMVVGHTVMFVALLLLVSASTAFF
ncbi:MAG: hypothetical protein QOG43_545 [Actinomycetota bacterium]|jgi:hypothetical protein|nr:hypothetical protein [Actinomycetota bacterium]